MNNTCCINMQYLDMFYEYCCIAQFALRVASWVREFESCLPGISKTDRFLAFLQKFVAPFLRLPMLRPFSAGFRRADDCSCKSRLCSRFQAAREHASRVLVLSVGWLQGIHCELPWRLWYQCRWSWRPSIWRTKAASICGAGYPYAAQDLALEELGSFGFVNLT